MRRSLRERIRKFKKNIGSLKKKNIWARYMNVKDETKYWVKEEIYVESLERF